MMEAEITCVCTPGIKLPDLGLDLKKGDVVYIPAMRARISKDLSRARAGVTLRMVERCREQREAPPPAPVPTPAPPQVVRQAQPGPENPDLESTVKKLLHPLVEQVAALRREAAATGTVVPKAEGTPESEEPAGGPRAKKKRERSEG